MELERLFLFYPWETAGAVVALLSFLGVVLILRLATKRAWERRVKEYRNRKTEHHRKVKAFMQALRTELRKSGISFYSESVYRSKRLPSIKGESGRLSCGAYLFLHPCHESDQVCFSIMNDDLLGSTDRLERHIRVSVHKAILDQVCWTARDGELMWSGRCDIEDIEAIGFVQFAKMMASSLTRYQLLHDVSRNSGIYGLLVNAYQVFLENQKKMTECMIFLNMAFSRELPSVRKPEHSFQLRLQP